MLIHHTMNNRTQRSIKLMLCFLLFSLCHTAGAAVEDAIYYFYNRTTDTFLSRGADWGTRATLDKYGIPLSVENQQNGTARIRYADRYNVWLGADGYPYTDKNMWSPISWDIQTTDDNCYILYNTGQKAWLVSGTGTNGCDFTTTEASATHFELLNQEQYAAVMEQRKGTDPFEGKTPIDISFMLSNAGMEGGVTGWNSTFTRGVGLGAGLVELYEGYGTISQTLTGMAPGWYAFSFSGFFRGASNEICSGLADDGWQLGNAIAFANDSVQRIATWASERLSNGNPNSMNQAAALINGGRYTNIVYTYVGSDGILTVGISLPQYNPMQWLIWDAVKLERLASGDPVADYSDLLGHEIAQLRELLNEKDYLSDELVAQAEEVIATALQSQTAEEFLAAIQAVRDIYAECKAYRIPVLRNDPYVKYLFAYFPNNNDENLYYAVSDDGFAYTPLNEGQRVMSSDSVALKKGIRDPHILRGVDGNTFYMVATDMRCAEGWDSNRGMVLYKSTDLIHWQHSTVHFPTRFPEWKNVTRVWAPETIWDPEYENEDGSKGRYMVYYSLLTNDGKCKYDKVFYSYVNDDFTDLLTDPEYFYDRGGATIDADIIYDETDLLYHMIFKNEGAGGICSVTAKHLTPVEGEEPGTQWSKPSGTLQQTNVAVEGGGLFRLINTNTWVLMYDCYGSGYYQFCTTEDWEKFNLVAQTTMSGAFTPRHGSVLPLTPDEYNAVLEAFPTSGLEPVWTGINDTPQAAQETAVPVAVYSLGGTYLGKSADTLPHGTYITKQADGTFKKTVK